MEIDRVRARQITTDERTELMKAGVMSRQGRSPDLGYVDFRMTKH
jgi:hypothetical protein